MIRDNIVEKILSKSKLFRNIEKDFLHSILMTIKEKRYKIGDKIISEGSDDKDIFIILKGKVITCFCERDRKKVLNYLFKGDIFGEIGFFIGEQPVTYQCLEDTTVGVIKHLDFRGFLTANKSLLMNLTEILAYRLYSANHEIRNLSFKPVRERVSEVIVKSLDKSNTLDITIKEIADLVGAERETVSRVITNLEKLGYVSRVLNNKIKVLNVEKLESIFSR